MLKLLRHFREAQAMAACFVEPRRYVNRNGVEAVNDADRDSLFANDMVYMFDGPEQREAEAHIVGQGLDACFEQIQTVHRLFGTRAPKSPQAQTPAEVERRANWIKEEAQELLDAIGLVDQADAYLDIIVFAIGGMVELGVEPGRLFEIVMASQFAKVWADGKPRVREDGKWIKPPGWVAPEPQLQAEIIRQIG